MFSCKVCSNTTCQNPSFEENDLVPHVKTFGFFLPQQEVILVPVKVPDHVYSYTTKQNDGKRILLKYGISIFESDMNSLNNWLSDAIVNFFALHLYEKLPEQVKQKINIIQSTSCYLIKYDSHIKPIVKNLNIIPTKWNFFIFNLNSDFGEYKGPHWSLLLFNPETQCFFFVDSMTTKVPALVQNFAKKVMSKMDVQPHAVENVHCPKNENERYCGIYVIEYMKSILNKIAEEKPWQNFSITKNREYMKSRPAYWKNLILELAAYEEYKTFQINQMPEKVASCSERQVEQSNHRQYTSDKTRIHYCNTTTESNYNIFLTRLNQYSAHKLYTNNYHDSNIDYCKQRRNNSNEDYDDLNKKYQFSAPMISPVSQVSSRSITHVRSYPSRAPQCFERQRQPSKISNVQHLKNYFESMMLEQ